MKRISLLCLFVFALATTSHAALSQFDDNLTQSLEAEDLGAIGRSIEYGADILLQRPSDGRNALHIAAFHATMDGDYTLVEYILEHANLERSLFLDFINQKDSQGNTPLHMAYMSLHGDEYVQELLINAGADQEIRNHQHLLPAQLAEETDSEDASDSGNDSDDEDTEMSDLSDIEPEEQPSMLSDISDILAISYQE